MDTNFVNETLYRLALAQTPLSLFHQNELLETLTATEIFENSACLEDVFPQLNVRFRNVLSKLPEYVNRASEEMEFADKQGIQVLTSLDNDYPYRLKHTPDAPIVLFKSGNGNLNHKHTVSIVGTRRCSKYGQDLCRQFVEELKQSIPDVAVFSGLAYGIDICAHHACLDNDLPTFGIMAHGLDTIYPALHRNDAVRMCRNGGGIITEYMSRTPIMPQHFLARNRIIAGCADATLIVESGERGGSLCTATRAFDYARQVFVFPGRVSDKNSLGCLDLVYNDKAVLIRNLQQFLDKMSWKSVINKSEPIQTELFPQLNTNEQEVVEVLSSCEFLSVEQLAIKLGVALSSMHALILSLELKSIIESLPGGYVRLHELYR